MLRFSNLFSNHAVLQREMPIPVWGWSAPHTRITLELNGQSVAGITDAYGRFLLRLPPMAAGGPYTLTASNGCESVSSSDIYIGEVWVAGGQSNMALALATIGSSLLSDDEICTKKFPQTFRMLTVSRQAVTVPQDDIEDTWMLPNSENFWNMSAAASYFAEKISTTLSVPVGILSCNWGGTIAEAWLSFEALYKNPVYREKLLEYEARISADENTPVIDDFSSIGDACDHHKLPKELLAYLDAHPEVLPDNMPSEGREQNDYDDSAWPKVSLPGDWFVTMGEKTPGIVWYRREINIPATWNGQNLEIWLGAISQQDVTYFNGVKIGSTGTGLQSRFDSIIRHYSIPASLVRPGKAIIAVRVFNPVGPGGMKGQLPFMHLDCPALPAQSISLTGPWKAQMVFSYGSLPGFNELSDSEVNKELVEYVSHHPELLPDNHPSEGREGISYDDSAWQTATLPSPWQKCMKLGDSGVVWFRKEVIIPEAWNGKELLLELGAIDKQDVTYFNGEKIGASGSGLDTKYWDTLRKYPVPASLVKPGRAVIAVRAFSFMYDGGFIGPAENMKLTCPSVPGSPISLVGEWKGQQTVSYKGAPVLADYLRNANDVSTADSITTGCFNPNSYHILFDSMLKPLIPYAVRGAIWYQGESNASINLYYRKLMNDLINDWRTRWNQPEFAFYQVILAGWQNRAADNWMVIREAQIKSAEDTKTGVASAVDIGEVLDIHPRFKKEIGERLALATLEDIYHVPGVIGHGPKAIKAQRIGGNVVISCEYTDGMTAKNGSLGGFELVDLDGKTTPIIPEIDGNTLIFRQVHCTTVQIRYAWKPFPADASCYNKAGLPMLPFRINI